MTQVVAILFVWNLILTVALVVNMRATHNDVNWLFGLMNERRERHDELKRDIAELYERTES